MAISEINPTVVKIDKLIARVVDGDIKIPAFQRRFVWNQEQVIELLDSIYRDYPIGSILLWNSDDTKLKATRNVCGFDIPDRPDSYPVNYVLDGQQRVSAIYAVFCKDRTRTKTDDEDPSLDIFDIHFDLDSRVFRASSDLVPGNYSFPLQALLDFTALFNALAQIPQKYHDTLKALHSQFINYEVPVVTVTKRSKAEVGTIFERVNSTGTELSTLDLLIAWTWSEDFLLKEEIDELLDTLESKRFGKLPDKTILQCLSAIIVKSTTTKSILNLEPKEVHERFPKLVESMERAIDFLSTQLHASKDFLPHVQQLIPLTFFFSKIDSVSSEQMGWLKQWFWKTTFSRRYAAQTDEKMDSDIALFEQLIDGNPEGLSKYSYSVTPEQLVKQKFTRSSPLVRGLLLLLAQKHPIDLVHGGYVDLGKALSEFNSKEYHHIFPRAYLKKREVLPEKINSLCNFCFLTADSNKKISAKSPSEYFAELIPPPQFLKILESNLMPFNKEIYEKNDYEKFLVQRSQLIMSFLDEQLA